MAAAAAPAVAVFDGKSKARGLPSFLNKSYPGFCYLDRIPYFVLSFFEVKQQTRHTVYSCEAITASTTTTTTIR